MILFSMSARVFTAAVTAPLIGLGTAAATPHPQTMTDLHQSMRGEAFANAAYTVYAQQSGRQGLSPVAALFQRAAGVELGEHFAAAAKLAGVAGDDAANLKAAIAGEDYESGTMYPTFALEA